MVSGDHNSRDKRIQEEKQLMKMKKRFLSILLSLVIALGLMPGMSLTAYADNYNLWVGGTQVTSENMSDVFSDGKVSYTPAQGETAAKLKLNGYNYEGNGYFDLDECCYYAIWTKENLIIELSGTNSIKNTQSSSYAIYRTDNTLLVDAGDTIQDNSADIFVGMDCVHSMVQAVNALNYDVWVTGNHEYNYGMDVTKKTIADMKAKVLVGNVYDEEGKPIADGYTIVEMDGVRVAVIGMVTPNITHWDSVNLANCTVTDPLEETRRIIDSIQGQYDVLLGVFHMGLVNEYGVTNSGVTDILNACPEFDVMVSSHEHAQIPSMDISGVMVVQNKNMAQTMSVIDLALEKTDGGWKVADKKAESVNLGSFDPDPAIVELLTPYDEQAKADAEVVVGRLEGGALAPENEIREIPTAQIQDTALIDLINQVQMHYTGAPVSAAALFVMDANMFPVISTSATWWTYSKCKSNHSR